MQMPLLKVNTDVSIEAMGLNLNLCFHLHSCFVNAGSDGFDEHEHI